MKMSKKISKKLIVSALSTGMGVSLVGAITGTVAWYQYSTRSTVSFVGTSVGTSENLLVSFQDDADEYKNDLYFSDSLVEMAPVTSGALLKNAPIVNPFKAQPIYQKFNYNQWIDAQNSSYVQFPLYLRLDEIDANGQSVASDDERTVFLSELVIDNANPNNSGKKDISNAIRVHIETENECMLISKTGETTDVSGYLDLNNDGRPDSDSAAYIFNGNATPVAYGAGQQTAYQPSDVLAQPNQSGILSGDHNLGTFNSAQLVVFGQGEDFEDGVVYYDDIDMQNETADAVAEEGKNYYIHRTVIKATITIWLEGWQKFDRIRSEKFEQNFDLDGQAETTYYTDAACNEEAHGLADGNTTYYFHSMEAVWEPEFYVGSIFNIGLMFEVNPNL